MHWGRRASWSTSRAAAWSTPKLLPLHCERLRERRIAGAGLDVYESEPKRPEQLIGLDNVLLTPHLAGWSPEATQASVDRFMANAEGHFSGRGVVSPV